MADEVDEIGEVFGGHFRVLLTAAGQVGELVARRRQEELRRVQAASEQEARELQSRFETERRVARVELANVGRDDWWAQSTPEQIERAYQVAKTWSVEDQEIARAQHQISSQLRTRYGIDTQDLGADPNEVRQLIRLQAERVERDRLASREERTRAEEEEAEARLLLAQSSQADRYAAQQAEGSGAQLDSPEVQRLELVAAETRDGSVVLHDSAERRQRTADELTSRGIDSDIVDTRMKADISQGAPATAAVTRRRKSAPQARKASTAAVRQRSELNR